VVDEVVVTPAVVVGASVDVGGAVDDDDVVAAPSPSSLHATSAAAIVLARNPRRVSHRSFSSTFDLWILVAAPAIARRSWV
jgi:hypothetical protein